MIKGIPSKFEMFGETIVVEFDDQLATKRDNFGETDYKSAKIILQTPIEGIICESQIVETYYHELTHMILGKLSYDELNGDEKAVTAIGGLLCQALTTAVYGDKG